MKRGAKSPAKTAACLAALLALIGPLSALEWDEKSKSAKLGPLVSEFEVKFAFANKSAHPVRILHVDTNCDCLSAAPDKRVLKPGEQGVLRANFTVGDRVGLYERAITVLTDESAQPQRLIVRVEVPEIATVSPRTLEWSIGDRDATERPSLVEVAPGLVVEFPEVGYSAPGFKARVEPIQGGGKYRVWIKPDTTATAASVAVRLIGREKSGRSVVVSVYASVR